MGTDIPTIGIPTGNEMRQTWEMLLKASTLVEPKITSLI